MTYKQTINTVFHSCDSMAAAAAAATEIDNDLCVLGVVVSVSKQSMSSMT